MTDAPSNPFLDLEDRQTPRPVKVRKEAAKKAAVTREAKREEEEERILLSLFLADRRQEKDSLLAGPLGAQVKAILSFARGMTLESAPELIDRVECAAWALDLSIDDRFVLLRLLNNAIVNLRVRNGLPPFHDALPDEAPRAFHRIKTMLGLDGR